MQPGSQLPSRTPQPPRCPCLWLRKPLFRERKGFTHFVGLPVTRQEQDPGQGSQVRDRCHTPAVTCAASYSTPSQGTKDGTSSLAPPATPSRLSTSRLDEFTAPVAGIWGGGTLVSRRHSGFRTSPDHRHLGDRLVVPLCGHHSQPPSQSLLPA